MIDKRTRRSNCQLEFGVPSVWLLAVWVSPRIAAVQTPHVRRVRLHVLGKEPGACLLDGSSGVRKGHCQWLQLHCLHSATQALALTDVPLSTNLLTFSTRFSASFCDSTQCYHVLTFHASILPSTFMLLRFAIDTVVGLKSCRVATGSGQSVRWIRMPDVWLQNHHFVSIHLARKSGWKFGTTRIRVVQVDPVPDLCNTVIR